jgi:hypothetical protein
MAGIDRYLAVCGPPFFASELDSEQLAEHQLLQNIVFESNLPSCSKSQFTIAQYTNNRLQYNTIELSPRMDASATVLNMALAPLAVTRGKRGLCFDVSKVSDTKMRDRLLKNRESADQSRRRRLETAKRYERRLMELNTDNESLLQTRTALLNRIQEIELALARHRQRDDEQAPA